MTRDPKQLRLYVNEFTAERLAERRRRLEAERQRERVTALYGVRPAMRRPDDAQRQTES